MHYSLSQRFAKRKKRITLLGTMLGMMLGALSTLGTLGFLYAFLLQGYFESEGSFMLLMGPGGHSHGFEIGMSRLEALGVIKGAIKERQNTQSGSMCPNALYYITTTEGVRCPNNPADVIKEVPKEEWEKEYEAVLRSDEWRWCTYDDAIDYIRLYFENDDLLAMRFVPYVKIDGH